MGRYARALVVVTLLLLGMGVGCADSRPAPPNVNTPKSDAPKQQDDRDNPLVKEAKIDTQAVLNDLLAGKYDDDPSFAPVARKLKGFRTWSIESQNIDPDSPNAVNFGGTLKGPQGDATFVASMRKQQNSKWMIGYFHGPTRK